MKKRNSGFTLIETLIVVFLIGIVLVAGGNIFFGIMKGSSKAEIEKEVKQNGSYALAVMERMIRNSRRVTACDDLAGASLEIENSDYGLTTFQLGEGRIASSSAGGDLYLTTDNITVSSLTFTCVFDPPSSSDPQDIRRVGINFILSVGAAEAPETFAEIEFQTSVSLRNF